VKALKMFTDLLKTPALHVSRFHDSLKAIAISHQGLR